MSRGVLSFSLLLVTSKISCLVSFADVMLGFVNGLYLFALSTLVSVLNFLSYRSSSTSTYFFNCFLILYPRMPEIKGPATALSRGFSKSPSRFPSCVNAFLLLSTLTLLRASPRSWCFRRFAEFNCRGVIVNSPLIRALATSTSAMIRD